MGVRTSLPNSSSLQKTIAYIKWCKGCKNDFSFRTECGIQNELRTATLYCCGFPLLIILNMSLPSSSLCMSSNLRMFCVFYTGDNFVL